MTTQGKNGKSGYEKQDTNAFKIGVILVLSIGLLVIVVVFVNNLFITTTEEIITDAVLKPDSVPLRELRAHEIEILSSYGIVDAQLGIYRIPIERAMEILSEEAFSK